MTDRSALDAALALLNYGDVEGLEELLIAQPELALARDDGNATLLIRLIDWPGHRPWASETARVLLKAGAEVDARRDAENGTPLSGALCTEETDVIRVLLEHGADVHAPCGWQPGSVLDLADEFCQRLDRVNDEKFREVAEMFSKAGGRTLPSRTPMGGSTPMLFVKNVDAGVEFYTNQLGFRVNWSMDSESECGKYVSVQRGETEFHMTGCACPDGRHIGNLYIRVEVGAVDPLYEELLAAKVKMRVEPTNQPWGFREFEIEDPDGNWIIFYGAAVEEE